jgi:hypothetical protein
VLGAAFVVVTLRRWRDRAAMIEKEKIAEAKTAGMPSDKPDAYDEKLDRALEELDD